MNSRLFDIIGIVLTQAWGHMLIPTILGTIGWLIAGIWLDYVIVYLLLWIGAFLAIGWIITICFWVRHYWAIYRHEED